MHTISINDAITLIEEVAINLHEPVMLWGQPGVGKSEMLQQVAVKHSAELVDVRLSQYDSVDLRGFPGVHEATGLTVWHAPSTLPFIGNPHFLDGHPIILFLDEINAAAPAVSAVAYQLINDRRVGEHKLLDNVVVVAAGNREGDRGVTNRMPLPLANRLTHAEIGVDVDTWCEWAQRKGLPSIGVAFMQFRKPLLSTFDPAKPDKAFATPRTWVKALNYYASAMPGHTKQAAMAGAIGDGPAAEFWGFVDVWHKMTPISKILADPEGIELPEEASMTYATTVSVSGALTAKTVKPLHKFLVRLSPEFAVLAWQLAVKRDDGLFSTKEFIDFSQRYKVIF